MNKHLLPFAFQMHEALKKFEEKFRLYTYNPPLEPLNRIIYPSAKVGDLLVVQFPQNSDEDRVVDQIKEDVCEGKFVLKSIYTASDWTNILPEEDHLHYKGILIFRIVPEDEYNEEMFPNTVIIEDYQGNKEAYPNMIDKEFMAQINFAEYFEDEPMLRMHHQRKIQDDDIES